LKIRNRILFLLSERGKRAGCENQQDCIADIDFHILGSKIMRQLIEAPSFYQTVDTGTI